MFISEITSLVTRYNKRERNGKGLNLEKLMRERGAHGLFLKQISFVIIRSFNL